MRVPVLSTGSTRAWAAVGVAAVLAAGCSGPDGTGDGDGPIAGVAVDTSAIPDVTGQTEARAAAMIVTAGAAAGIDVEVLVETLEDGDFEVGTVIESFPHAGDPLATVVVLTVATEQLLTVPNVMGLTRQDASRQLTSEGFGWRIQEVESDEAEDHVVKQRPAPGSETRGDTDVVLSVSMGPKVRTIYGLWAFAASSPVAVFGYDEFGNSFQLDQSGSDMRDYEGRCGVSEGADTLHEGLALLVEGPSGRLASTIISHSQAGYLAGVGWECGLYFTVEEVPLVSSYRLSFETSPTRALSLSAHELGDDYDRSEASIVYGPPDAESYLPPPLEFFGA